MCVDRRARGRTVFTGGYLPPAARIRPGRDVVIVDLSRDGALVEGPWRFRPLSRCDVHLQVTGQDVHLRARIVRCFVARIERQEPVRYRTALAFDRAVDLPERWDALDGYSIPADFSESSFSGVVDTPTPVAVSSPHGPEPGNAPVSRSA
jgi:PilZ domain-containing protein